MRKHLVFSLARGTNKVVFSYGKPDSPGKSLKFKNAPQKTWKICRKAQPKIKYMFKVNNSNVRA